MWSADEVLLPAVYLQVGEYFNIGPKELGLLTFVRGLTESIVSFPAGFTADIYERPKLICVGVVAWSVALAGCAVAPSFLILVVFRMINGAGLGLVQPILWSLISDVYDPSSRGLAFGTLQFTGDIGVATASYVATALAATIILGVRGWKFVLVVNAILSAAIGFFVLAVAAETRDRSKAVNKSILGVIKEKMPVACGIFRVRTFMVIIGQGIFGTAPWFGLAYLAMWLQLLCFSPEESAKILMCFRIGTAMGGLLSGELLDRVSARYPDHGPAWMAMFSVGSGIPLFGYIFYGLGGLPLPSRSIAPELSLAFLTTGMLLSWCGVVNKKVFSDIVPGDQYTYIFAIDRMLEGSIAALATPAVGVITEDLFGYHVREHQEGDSECAPDKAFKLGQGMFFVCATAWGACFLCYTFLHLTYPKDRIKLQGLSCDADGDGGVDSISGEMIGRARLEPDDDTANLESNRF